ncbi:MAG TPA: hypothetical protein VH025_02020 [Solirubrobacteraceae bacterium]|jgi:hypothetical protein|nr:hypothetical protein [Solirubrobacteraceae bacterium]
MTAVWIGSALLALALALTALWLLLNRDPRRAGDDDRVEILELDDETSIDHASGAVRSVQKADVLIDRDALADLWTPRNLERLARTYWRFLTHVTLGLIQVRYTEGDRSVVFIGRPLKLLTFQAPEYEMSATRGLVRWRIERGLLVSRRGRGGEGYLQIEVLRRGGQSRGDEREAIYVEVEVANFYPSIATGLGRRLYNATQSRIHVIVTYGFLRSLARLDLAESRVGRLDGQTPPAA